jgi:serine/threonine protein kinase
MKVAIITYLLSRDELKDDTAAFMVSGGPIFMKLMQGLAEHHVDLRISYEKVVKMTKEEYNLSHAKLVSNTKYYDGIKVNENPISVASIGQVHLAKLNDKDVIVKFLKPRVTMQYLEELEYMKTIQTLVSEPAKQYLWQLFISVGSEFFLNSEVQNSVQCSLAYDNQMKSISVCKILTPIENDKDPTTLGALIEFRQQFHKAIYNVKTDFKYENIQKHEKYWKIQHLEYYVFNYFTTRGAQNNYYVKLSKHLTTIYLSHIVMERAQGVSLQSILASGDVARCLALKQSMLSLIQLWVFQALFITNKNLPGILHADLHPGNILVHEGRLAKFTLIDFGHIGHLYYESRCKLINLVTTHTKMYETSRGFLGDKKKYDKTAQKMFDYSRKVSKLLSSLCPNIVWKNDIGDVILNWYRNCALKNEVIGFSDLLQVITENVSSIGDCATNGFLDFAKGSRLLNGTWTSFLKAAKLPYQDMMQAAVTISIGNDAVSKVKACFNKLDMCLMSFMCK